MIKISEEYRNLLREYIENVDELIDNDSLDDLLIEIDSLVLRKGFTKDYFLNDFGKKFQGIRDDVYEDNVEDDGTDEKEKQ